MTTQKLRQDIQVVSFHSHTDGAAIKYIINGEVRSLVYNTIALFEDLISIGSIDNYIDPELWADYNLSQWDALNLVIQHEYEKAIGEEINNW